MSKRMALHKDFLLNFDLIGIGGLVRTMNQNQAVVLITVVMILMDLIVVMKLSQAAVLIMKGAILPIVVALGIYSVICSVIALSLNLVIVLIPVALTQTQERVATMEIVIMEVGIMGIVADLIVALAVAIVGGNISFFEEWSNG